MKKKLLWFLILATLALLLWGGSRAWQRQSTQDQALAADAAARKEARILLQSDEVLLVQERTLNEQIPMSGTVRPQQLVSVKAQSGGQVLDLTVREGDTVQTGQLLFRVAAPDMGARLSQAQQQARAADADRQVAQRNAQNNRALAEQGFLSPTAQANSDAALLAARAQHEAALAAIEVAQKSVADTRTTSPISGVVAARHIRPEEVVAPGQAVLDIVDLAEFELQAEIPASDALRVQVGQQARLRVEGSHTDLVATVTRMNPATQTGSRSVLVYLHIQAPPSAHNANGLRDGLFAQGDILVGQLQGIAVPQTSIRNNLPQPYVLLIDDEQTVRMQPVTVGPRAKEGNTIWRLVQGLPAGSRILSGTAGLLSDGTRVRIGDASSAGNGNGNGNGSGEAQDS